MATYIGLLRGINVGGNRKVKMVELARWCEDAGCVDVRTYIQSGNIVFSHSSRSPASLAGHLSDQISAAAGFDIPLALRGATEWAQAIADNPFASREPTHLHVTFLDRPPPAGAFEAVDREGFAPEEFALRGRELYLYLPDGMARTKLPQALGLYSRLPATTRNWRTVLRLQELASRPPP